MREGGRGVTFTRGRGSGVEVDGSGVLRGSGVEVHGLRKRTAAAHSEGGGVEVDSLRKSTTTTRSEAEVEVAACSTAGDEAAVCSGAEIKDGRWQQQRDSF
jgi:hypothetical protein